MISISQSTNSVTIIISDPVTFTYEGHYTVNRDQAHYEAVMEAIRNNDEAAIKNLCNVSKAITTYTEGKVRVENGHVYYGNVLVEGIIVDRILGFIKEKLPIQPVLRFINKLMENPSSRAVNELYKFLEHRNMPIGPDGTFFAYKGVQNDYFSKTAGDIEVIEGIVADGKILNAVGQRIEVKRNQVCDNKDIGCSKGLHAGSLKYACEFGSGGKVVIVEIDPKDVVSIPTDCGCQKLRTCAYKVVGEFDGVPLSDNYCDAYSDDDATYEDETDENESDHCCGDPADGCPCGCGNDPEKCIARPADDDDDDEIIEVEVSDTNNTCSSNCECKYDETDTCTHCGGNLNSECCQHSDDSEPQTVLDDAFGEGFDDGYDDGVNSLGYQGTTLDITEDVVRNEHIVTAAQYSEVWKEGYQKGYDEGVRERPDNNVNV